MSEYSTRTALFDEKGSHRRVAKRFGGIIHLKLKDRKDATDRCAECPALGDNRSDLR
jgi:hypothetical protein